MTGAHRHLLVIGAQRSGTTALQHLLATHPEVSMARPQRPEPKVFLDPTIVDRGADWYREHWFEEPTSPVLYVEKSTSLIEVPAAAQRAREVLGDDDVRVLAQLRDPVERAVSNWRFSAAHGLEARPLETALSESMDGSPDWDPTRTSVSPYSYLERGRYAEHLAPWWDAFGDRVRVQFTAEMDAEPATVIVELLDWLGLDPTAIHPEPPAVNTSHGPRPTLSDSLVTELRGYFADSDRELAQRIGRPLPWPSVAAPSPTGTR